jgi:hypothetical protein
VNDDLIGRRFRLRDHVGYQPHVNPHHPWEQSAELWGHHAPLFRDQIGTVVAVVPAAEDGAGTKDEDHAVLAFEHRELVVPPPTSGARDHARMPPIAGEDPDTPWQMPTLSREHWVFHPTDPEHRPTGVTRHWSCTESQLHELMEEVQ